jgi:hypothetical protein
MSKLAMLEAHLERMLYYQP